MGRFSLAFDCISVKQPLKVHEMKCAIWMVEICAAKHPTTSYWPLVEPGCMVSFILSFPNLWNQPVRDCVWEVSMWPRHVRGLVAPFAIRLSQSVRLKSTPQKCQHACVERQLAGVCACFVCLGACNGCGSVVHNNFSTRFCAESFCVSLVFVCACVQPLLCASTAECPSSHLSWVPWV